MLSKASCGSSRPVLGGAICLPILASARRPAGVVCASGMRTQSGSRSGGSSWPNWTAAANSTGASVSSTGVSLPPKTGRRRRQNQAQQGHEVDGGGRRPRCSFGKPPGQRLAGRSDLGRADASPGPRATCWTRPAQSKPERLIAPTAPTTAIRCGGGSSTGVTFPPGQLGRAEGEVYVLRLEVSELGGKSIWRDAAEAAMGADFVVFVPPGFDEAAGF